MTGLRAWYRQYRVTHKVRQFTKLAVAKGWVTARLPEPALLPRGPILVLAPHVDDEALGCGGVLFLHRQAGDPVHIVYVLDDARRQTERQQEGDRAGRLVGCEVTHARCPQELEAVTQALEPIVRRQPSAVMYVPWMLDNHEGHLLVAHAVGRLLERGVTCSQVWCYEVWTPLIPNRLVDITSVFESKRQLLQTYASQLAQKDIASMGLGLSQYRGGFLARKDTIAAEAFLALSPAEYLACLGELRR